VVAQRGARHEEAIRIGVRVLERIASKVLELVEGT